MYQRTLYLVEIAIFAALAFLLDLVSKFVFGQIWVQGGSVSIAMVPVVLMAFRWGIKGGMLTGLLLGLLQVITVPSIFHPVQGFIDYFVAFSVVGLAGIFMKQVVSSYNSGKHVKGMLFGIAGIFIGSLLRFLCHFATGVIFFGIYAPANQPVILYSLIYNGTYMIPSFILTAIVVAMLYSAAPRQLLRKV